MIPVIIILVGLIGLYYLYQYLFGPKTNNTYQLITSTRSAQIDTTPIILPSIQLAPLYEGGEFTISTWIYISNWSHRAGYNKPIIRISGYDSSNISNASATNFDIIRIYLGAYKPTLQVRFHSNIFMNEE